MNIGEKIYKLRTEKNLSQGDLADMLDVSRQSVSKWENDTAIPDLDKLIKLCDVFKISLDELIGRAEIERASISETPQGSAITSTKIAGYVLLGITILSAVILVVTAPLAIYLCLPLLLSTIICFNAKRYAWYWCLWATYIPFEFFILLGIRIDIQIIVKMIFIVIITVITSVFIKDIDLNVSKTKRGVRLILSVITIAICVALTWLLFYSNLVKIHYDFDIWVFSFINMISTVVMGVGMYQVVALIREARQKK